MRPRLLVLIVSIVGILIAGCSVLVQVKPPEPVQLISPATRTTQEFYRWYLRYAESTGSPLDDRAFRHRKELASAAIMEIDRRLDAPANERQYDPFLCAQNRPTGIDFDDAVVSGDTATVVVHPIWGQSSTAVTVSLKATGDTWKITQIACSN